MDSITKCAQCKQPIEDFAFATWVLSAHVIDDRLPTGWIHRDCLADIFTRWPEVNSRAAQ